MIVVFMTSNSPDSKFVLAFFETHTLVYLTLATYLSRTKFKFFPRHAHMSIDAASRNLDREEGSGRKTRSLDLRRVRRHFQKTSGRQTNNFFSKRHFERLSTPQSFFSTIQGHKNALKSLYSQGCKSDMNGFYFVNKVTTHATLAVNQAIMFYFFAQSPLTTWFLCTVHPSRNLLRRRWKEL